MDVADVHELWVSDGWPLAAMLYWSNSEKRMSGCGDTVLPL